MEKFPLPFSKLSRRSLVKMSGSPPGGIGTPHTIGVSTSPDTSNSSSTLGVVTISRPVKLAAAIVTESALGVVTIVRSVKSAAEIVKEPTTMSAVRSKSPPNGDLQTTLVAPTPVSPVVNVPVAEFWVVTEVSPMRSEDTIVVEPMTKSPYRWNTW